MTDDIVIRLAGEPKGKGRPKFQRATGRAFTPAATRSYEGALRYAAQESMGSRSPLEGALSCSIVAEFPVPASWSQKKREQALSGAIWPVVKPDGDNIMKMIDALNEVVFRDDKQVVDGRVLKRYSATPGVTIRIRPMA